MACSQCGQARGHAGGCPTQSPATGGGHRGKGKAKRTKGYQGRHAKPTQCTFTWSTPRPAGQPATGHYDHACVNAPKDDTGRCGGRHACRNWNCHETHA